MVKLRFDRKTGQTENTVRPFLFSTVDIYIYLCPIGKFKTLVYINMKYLKKRTPCPLTCIVLPLMVTTKRYACIVSV